MSIRDLQTQHKPLYPILSRPNILLLGILAGALALRLYNLGSLPIFTDEAIYSNWAMGIWAQRTRDALMIPIAADGKQPLFMWISAALIEMTHDPLTAGRITAAMSGLATTLGCYLLGRQLYGRAVGLIATALYAVMPLAVLHERMALSDPLLSALLLSSVVAFTEAIRAHSQRRGLLFSLLSGLLLGCALWTKITAALFMFFPIAAWLLLRDSSQRRSSVVLAPCYSAAVIGLLGLASLPNAHRMVSFTANFLQTATTSSPAAEASALGNMGKLIDWATSYVGPLALVLALFSASVRPRRHAWFLWIYLILPVAALSLVGTRIYARYMLPAAAPLAVLIAAGILTVARGLAIRGGHAIKSIVLIGSCALAVICPWAIFASTLISSPESAQLAPDDRYQYVSDWPSGFGLPEALSTVEQTASALERPVLLLTDPYMGLPGDAARTYFFNQSTVVPRTESAIVWGGASISADWRQHRVMTFVLVSDYRDNWQALEQNNPEMKLVDVYWKPGQKSYFRLYSADFGASGAETTPAANNAAGTR